MVLKQLHRFLDQVALYMERKFAEGGVEEWGEAPRVVWGCRLTCTPGWSVPCLAPGGGVCPDSFCACRRAPTRMSAGCCPAVSPEPPGPPAALWVPSSPLLGKLRSRKGAHGHMCCVSEPQAGYAVRHTGSAYIPPRQVVNNTHFFTGPVPCFGVGPS